MKLRPVTKLDKRKRTTLKKNNDDVILENFDIIIILKIIFSSIATFYLTKVKSELKNLKRSSQTIGLSKGTIFAKKC